MLVRGDECEMRTFDGVDPKRFVRRRIAPAQLAKFREALQKEKYESLANYSSDDILRDGSRTQTIGAARYMLIHMTASKGRRLYIHNPPHSLEEEPADNPGWPHRRLIDAFEAMASETEGETIYNLDRPIDGLKVVDESNPDVFWMARPERNGSLIGRYDSRNLRWRDEEWIPHLEIASRDICVSTSEKLAYVLHKGHLLALPLPEQSR